MNESIQPNQSSFPMNRTDYCPAPEGYDPRRWRLAQYRASFKRHLLMYVLINGFLVGLWFFTSPGQYFWPIWSMLGWGIGLVSHFFAAYGTNTTDTLVEREYKKLMDN